MQSKPGQERFFARYAVLLGLVTLRSDSFLLPLSKV